MKKTDQGWYILTIVTTFICNSVNQLDKPIGKKIKKYTLVKINLIATIITVSMWISDG